MLWPMQAEKYSSDLDTIFIFASATDEVRNQLTCAYYSTNARAAHIRRSQRFFICIIQFFYLQNVFLWQFFE